MVPFESVRAKVVTNDVASYVLSATRKPSKLPSKLPKNLSLHGPACTILAIAFKGLDPEAATRTDAASAALRLRTRNSSGSREGIVRGSPTRTSFV